MRSRTVLALEQLRDDVGRPFVLADVVDGDDVRMIQDPGRPGFLLEAAGAVFVGGEPTVEDLQGHVAGEAEVLRAVDLAHPAFTEEGEHLVRPYARSGSET